MADESVSRTFRILTALTVILAALLARKAVKAGWTFVTGESPPEEAENAEASIGRAVVWAMASGMAIGAARLIAARGLAKARRSTDPAARPAVEA